MYKCLALTGAATVATAGFPGKQTFQLTLAEHVSAAILLDCSPHGPRMNRALDRATSVGTPRRRQQGRSNLTPNSLYANTCELVPQFGDKFTPRANLDPQLGPGEHSRRFEDYQRRHSPGHVIGRGKFVQLVASVRARALLRISSARRPGSLAARGAIALCFGRTRMIRRPNDGDGQETASGRSRPQRATGALILIGPRERDNRVSQ
jgi:hypothetical protein